MKKLTSLFDKNEDGICVLNEHGKFEYINASAMEIFGFSDKKNIIGKAITDIAPFVEDNDHFVQCFIDAVINKEVYNEETVDFIRNDGEVRHFRIAVVFSDVGFLKKKKFIVTVSDYTNLLKTYSALERFTSKDIAKFIIDHPSGSRLGGVSVEATVLISDIRDFTAFSSTLDPETLVKTVNEYFTVMNAIIEKYNGTTLEFLGDGIFCVFGVPKLEPNHAENAVACAVEMQNAMRIFNAHNYQKGIKPIEVGIGINTGEVIMGNIGSKSTMKFQCMGQEVNLAGRIQTYCVGGHILVSENTYNHIGCKITDNETFSILPKGKTDEIKIFDVAGIDGSYKLFLQHDNETNIVLSKPFHTTFKKVNQKAVDRQIYDADIVLISSSGAHFKTDCPLSKLDEIMLDIKGNVFARIFECSDNLFEARFSSKIDSFEGLAKELEQ